MSQVLTSYLNQPKIYTPDDATFYARYGDWPKRMPLGVGNCKLWLSADKITNLADGDPVSSWPDSSGDGNNAVQATAEYQPIYKTGILNSKPVVRFDGTDDYMTCAAFMSGTTAATLFVVATIDSDDTYALIGTADNDGYYRYAGDGCGYMGAFRTARIAQYPSGMPSSGANIFALRSSTTEYLMRVNGVSKGVQAGSYSAGTKFEIGTQTDTAALTKYLLGDIAEILVYSGSLTDIEVSTVETYLANKYGISI